MIDNKDMKISSWLGLETRPGWAISEMCTFLDRFKNNTVPNHIFNTFCLSDILRQHRRIISILCHMSDKSNYL